MVSTHKLYDDYTDYANLFAVVHISSLKNSSFKIP